jgi:DNA-binding MarR family transcriptional regulator
VNVNIDKLNKAFENRIRLGIMAMLAVNEAIDFIALKDALELTDGNLASHLKALEKEDYIRVEKSFIGRKPNTRYAITPNGLVAFQHHISALEQLIHNIDVARS